MNALKIQQSFFNLLATVFYNESRNKYKLVLEELRELTEADFVGLLIHYENSSAFHVIESVSSKRGLEPVKYLPVECKQHEADFFKNEIDRDSIQTIPLQLATKEELLLLIVKNERLSDSMISTLKKESEKLFTILNEMDKSIQRNKNNKFLLDKSTKLMKSNDKNVILYEVVHGLSQIYPEFAYYLILPQEYEGANNLPIKIMEYADKSSIHPSTQVFMSGKLKLEVDKNNEKKTVYAPMIGEQSVYGVLEIIAPSEKFFTNEELEFISEFAILAGKALEQTTLYEDSLLQINNLTYLTEAIHELNSSKELLGIMALVKSKLIGISKASEVGLIWIDEDAEIGLKILPGSTPFFDQKAGYQLAQKVRKLIADNPEPILRGNYIDIDLDKFHSMMVFPMFHSGINMGFFIMLAEEKYHFTFEAFKLIKALVQHSSLAIANTILKEKLQTAVITDFLTKLHSRNHLENKMDRHIKQETNGVFLLYDIDDFKCVNDQYGHHVGDKVLKQVGHVLQMEIPDRGIAARWGGEELAVYIPEMDLESGKQLANRVRLAVEKMTNPRVTISCGISYWTKGYNDSRKELFLQADKALYEAKAAGKNRVLISS